MSKTPSSKPPSSKPPSKVLLDRLLALHPRLIDLSLNRMWRLLAALDHPQDKCPPVIHIAGTNGKGSTAAMLRAMLEADGKTVHAYHSPHLVRFHERIVLAGKEISEAALADALARTQAANQGHPITFFEVTTAAAFLAFSESQADYLILEVGLGGRLDATNVVTPKLAAITPISLDHQDFLGDTLLSIGAEKAGILKPGVSTIVAAQEAEISDFLRHYAAQKGAPIACADEDFTAYEAAGRLIFRAAGLRLDLPLPKLAGRHQLVNAATALALAQHLAVSESAMAKGLKTVRWPARLQPLSRGPLVESVAKRLAHASLWLDGGHNEAAAKALADWLAQHAGRPVHLILGMLGTKAHHAYLAALKNTGAHIHAVPIVRNDEAHTAEALTPEALRQAALAQGLNATAHDTIESALGDICAPDALILIAGSLYLAGQVLADNG